MSIQSELSRLQKAKEDLKAALEGKGVSVPEWISMPYAHEADLTLHAKMSVSELKERGQFTDDGESDFLPTIPDFMRTPEPESLLQDEPAEPVSRRNAGIGETNWRRKPADGCVRVGSRIPGYRLSPGAGASYLP